MIYLAGVADGVITMFGIVLGICGMAVMLMAFCYAEDVDRPFRWLKHVIACAVLSALLTVFVPDKDTIYAIAASEMGEEVLKTPEASKARQALNAWLDKKIGDTKPEAE